MFQHYNLVPTLTVGENVFLPLELDGRNPAECREAARIALQEVGLDGLDDRFPDEVSGGQAQRAAIARALIGERRVLLADEPTGALDTTTGDAVLPILRERVNEGAAGMIVTHEPRFAGWADRVIVVRDGRLAVLAYGLVAGVLGASAGAALGVGATTVSWMLTYPGWPLSVPWGYVDLLWLLAVIASTATSLLPAWVAARASISAGVQGATPDRLLRWHPWMAVGPVGLMLLAGVTGVMWLTVDHGVISYYGPLTALAFVVLLAASAPALVWAMGRMDRSAPLAWRLALRDAGRQSLRSVPALAAIMTVVALSVAFHAGSQAASERSHDLYGSVYESRSILITPERQDGHSARERDVEDVVSHVLSVTGPAERPTLRGVRSDWYGESFLEINYREFCRTQPASEQCALWERHDRVSGPLEWAGGFFLEASPELLDLLRIDEPVDLCAPAILVPRDTIVEELSLQDKVYHPDSDTYELLDEVTLPVLPVLPELMSAAIITPAEEVTFDMRRDIAAWVQEETVGTTVNILPLNNRPDWWPAAFAEILGLGVVVAITLVLALSWLGASRRRRGRPLTPLPGLRGVRRPARPGGLADRRGVRLPRGVAHVLPDSGPPDGRGDGDRRRRVPRPRLAAAAHPAGVHPGPRVGGRLALPPSPGRTGVPRDVEHTRPESPPQPSPHELTSVTSFTPATQGLSCEDSAILILSPLPPALIPVAGSSCRRYF